MAAKKRNKRKKTSMAGLILKTLLLMFLIICLGLVGVFYFGGYYAEIKAMKQDADRLVVESTPEDFVPSQTGEIYDAADNLISETRAEKDSTYLLYDEIPEVFTKTMMSIEDKKFMEHHGVDYRAIMRAAKELIAKRRITQGGSTITMQLSRGIFLTNEVSWRRKVKEIFIAQNLEKKYSKKQIMEFYLNNIYFANGYYGIEAASEGYFNRHAADLDVSQVAFLCAIPNSPTYYDPIVNMENTLTRRDLILDNMLQDGVISQTDHDAAVAEQIVLDLSDNSNYRVLENNYIVSYTYHCATEALMQMQGFELRYDFASDDDKAAYEESYNEVYSECEAKLYTGGYKIYTTFDMDKQAMLQESVDEGLASFTDIDDQGKYKMQGASVCIDNSTGAVVAMVGGRTSELEAGLTLNRAFQMRRQPGSCIKPLVVYTPAFEHGYFPKTEVEDQEIENGPSNYGGGYMGELELQEAVQRSLNTVAWQVYEDVTPQVGLKYLKDMEFHHICDSDNVLATALGGFTHGVEPVEMASAYATLQYDGFFRRPTCIRYIRNFSDEVVYIPEDYAKRVYQKNADRMMVNVLKGVFEEPWGTGRGLRLSGGMPCAGKTGTTDDFKDGWFCGFTHYFTTVVWVGCDTPETVRNLQGATYPGGIWRSYMEKLHEGLAPVDFPDYDHTEEDKLYDDDDDDWDDWDDEEEKKPEQKPAEVQPVVPPVVEPTPAVEPGSSGGKKNGSSGGKKSGSSSGGKSGSSGGNTSESGGNQGNESGGGNESSEPGGGGNESSEPGGGGNESSEPGGGGNQGSEPGGGGNQGSEPGGGNEGGETGGGNEGGESGGGNEGGEPGGGGNEGGETGGGGNEGGETGGGGNEGGETGGGNEGGETGGGGSEGGETGGGGSEGSSADAGGDSGGGNDSSASSNEIGTKTESGSNSTEAAIQG